MNGHFESKELRGKKNLMIRSARYLTCLARHPSGVELQNFLYFICTHPQAKQNPSPAAVADPHPSAQTLYMLTLRGLGAKPIRQITLQVIPTTNTTTRLFHTNLRPLHSTTSSVSPWRSRLPQQQQQQQQCSRRSLVVAHVAQRKQGATRSDALHTTTPDTRCVFGCWDAVACIYIHGGPHTHPFVSELPPS